MKRLTTKEYRNLHRRKTTAEQRKALKKRQASKRYR